MLPDQDRLVITLLLEGLSYREIAEVTGLTVNYVGVKLSRIKQAIEQRMTEEAMAQFEELQSSGSNSRRAPRSARCRRTAQRLPPLRPAAVI